MTGLKIEYARVSTDAQDLTVQREALAAIDVDPQRAYVRHGLTGTHRARPGLREAMAACRTGDTLVVTKLGRLARSVPDARDIVDEVLDQLRPGDTLVVWRLDRLGALSEGTAPGRWEQWLPLLAGAAVAAPLIGFWVRTRLVRLSAAAVLAVALGAAVTATGMDRYLGADLVMATMGAVLVVVGARCLRAYLGTPAG